MNATTTRPSRSKKASEKPFRCVVFFVDHQAGSQGNGFTMMAETDRERSRIMDLITGKRALKDGKTWMGKVNAAQVYYHGDLIYEYNREKNQWQAPQS